MSPKQPKEKIHSLASPLSSFKQSPMMRILADAIWFVQERVEKGEQINPLLLYRDRAGQVRSIEVEQLAQFDFVQFLGQEKEQMNHLR